MYVDGKLVAESKATLTKTLFDNKSALRIGQDFNEDAKRFFNGIIDEVAIFNRALTQAEIQVVMKGNFLSKATSVTATADKLSVTWSQLKVQHTLR